MYLLFSNYVIRPIVGALIILFVAQRSGVTAQTSSTISFAVHKEGKGRPMIFIPGIFCSGEVWDDAVKHYSKNFTCYTLTLPGFAGQPPIKSDSILLTVVHQLASYIRREKLEKPVIVGHSLGGWLALAFAIYYPDLTGDLVIVSSAPFFPAFMMGSGTKADSAAKLGEMAKGQISGMTVEQMKQYQERYFLPIMMRDSIRKSAVLRMALRSDSYTQGEVYCELFSIDLRPLVKRIPSRILVLGDWISFKQFGGTHETMYSRLHEQFKNHPVIISINDNTLHYIMFDEPKWFYAQVDNFLKF